MDKSAAINGDTKRAETYEESAEVCHARQFNLSSYNNGEFIPRSHPIVLPTPSPIGSALGVVQADYGLELHLEKLPASIGSLVQHRFIVAQAARKRGDWEEAIREYEKGREFLKSSEAVARDTRDWILTWVDLPLAYLYQYRARDCEKAVEMWKEMLECAMRQVPPDPHLQNGYRRLLAQAEFEWKCLHTSDGSHETIQQYAKLCGVKENRAEHELCFCLYFGHYHHGANFEESLRWLLRAKALDEQHSPGRMCSRGDEFTFCCEYDYLRSEAELLIKLRKFEEAAVALKHMLGTRHVQEGDPRLAAEVCQWFYAQLRGSGAAAEEIADLRRGIEGSLVTDIYERDSGISDRLPSPTGCDLNLHLMRLTQSKAGLEQHLLEVPVPIHLAFQKYTGMGLRSQSQHDWEGAAYHHEMCRELLKLSGTAISRKTWDWLLVWASLPLAQIYQYRKKQIKRALDIWMDMICVVDEEQPDTKDIRNMMFFCLIAGQYECTLSDYPDLKVKVLEKVVNASTVPAVLPDAMMDIFCENFGTNISGFNEIWVQEVFFLRFLATQHIMYGNCEVGLEFIQRGKRLLEENLSENEVGRKRATYNDVISEAIILSILLGRSKDAIEVLNKYGEGLTAADNEKLRLLNKRFHQHRISVNFDDWSKQEALFYGSSRPKEITTLIQLAISDTKDGRLKEAAMRNQTCVEISQSSSIFEEPSTQTILRQIREGGARFEQASTTEFTFQLGILYKNLYIQSANQSVLQGSLKLPSTDDANFSQAVECFKNITNPPSSSDFASPTDVYYQILAPRHLVELYNVFDRLFYAYFRNSFQDLITNSPEDIGSDMIKVADMDSITSLLLQYITKSPVIGPMEKYAQMASVQHISLLSTRKKYAESYIDSLDEDQSLTHLQDCYMRRGLLLDELQVHKAFPLYMFYYGYWSFLSAERERARVMLYQLGPNRPNYDTSRQLWQFDADNTFAIKAMAKTLGTRFPENDATVFVEYSREFDTLFGKKYFIYVYQAGSLYAEETIEDDPQRGIKTRLTALHKYFERRSSRRYNDSKMIEDLEYLFDVLMRPIAKFLEKMKPEDKLILAPSELLTKVPFYALRDREKPEGEKYLIQRHTIAFTSSLRVLQVCYDRLEELQKSPPYAGRGSIVALGDPEYGGFHDLLKSTGDEVREIESLFGEKADVVTLLGKDATAERLLHWAGKPSQGIKFPDVAKKEKKSSLDSFRQAIIHIGAHGEVDEEDHTKNVIRLARPEKSQSPSDVSKYDLTAEDLTWAEGRIEWRAELVVLSACRTSVGKLAGEGVLSLARAFMIAGVPCVVASQWEVGDTAACVLMKDFYRGWRAGKDVASALRFSILERLKVASGEVRDWAPFVVWGVPTLRVPSYLQQEEQSIQASAH